MGLGPVIDAMIEYDNDTMTQEHLPYSQQRSETISFLLMCWGGLAVSAVFCVVIFLLMNGAQRGSGGI